CSFASFTYFFRKPDCQYNLELGTMKTLINVTLPSVATRRPEWFKPAEDGRHEDIHIISSALQTIFMMKNKHALLNALEDYVENNQINFEEAFYLLSNLPRGVRWKGKSELKNSALLAALAERGSGWSSDDFMPADCEILTRTLQNLGGIDLKQKVQLI